MIKRRLWFTESNVTKLQPYLCINKKFGLCCDISMDEGKSILLIMNCSLWLYTCVFQPFPAFVLQKSCNNRSNGHNDTDNGKRGTAYVLAINVREWISYRDYWTWLKWYLWFVRTRLLFLCSKCNGRNVVMLRGRVRSDHDVINSGEVIKFLKVISRCLLIQLQYNTYWPCCKVFNRHKYFNS